MKYLLFEYGELPINIDDLPEVKYSYELNLNILKSNNKPAISVLDNRATGTSTKVYNETPDSDDNNFMLAGTQTHTFVNQENTDSDNDHSQSQMSLITMTTTRVEVESTDQD
ncbi:hypothetical protein VOI54_03030 [Tamlana sp. 2201CG12-4]|uniref:hypothetical protein n=1 Tax=Tamlana sp. 2201CG12-4 TaxID=3112582 RepID=UPI002DB571A4|nr:hypothetical protein [Tamlana sp. 2201CG12-4]MEC3905984.1 hypothetical protein [Tamlana sp. 2201CG12-4]